MAYAVSVECEGIKRTDKFSQKRAKSWKLRVD